MYIRNINLNDSIVSCYIYHGYLTHNTFVGPSSVIFQFGSLTLFLYQNMGPQEFMFFVF